MNDVVEVADSDQTQRVTQPALERSMLAAANSGDSPTKPAGCGCKHDLAPMEPPCAEAAIPPVQYVYAIGKIEFRIPNLSVEKEISQAVGRGENSGNTDQEALHKTLAQPENRYLLRLLCWVLVIQDAETYLLVPRDSSDLDLLVAAIRPQPRPGDLDVVLGVRGPLAPAQLCNGLTVPIVVFSQIYSFHRDELIDSIPAPDNLDKEKKAGGRSAEDRFRAAAGDVFDRIMQLADNAGSIDEHRAVNYLAMRYPAIYQKTAEEYQQDNSMSQVEAKTNVSGTRKITDVIVSYTNRKTDYTEKYYVRVDVTEEFPFLVSKLQPYLDITIGGVR
jgi:hypothetical protein